MSILDREEELAIEYLNTEYGVIHLEWLLENYWGQVCKKTILPTARLVYQELNNRGIKEEGDPFCCSPDGTAYYIPHATKQVFVQTTQGRDFLYIIDEINKRFDVRQIFRKWGEDERDMYPDDKMIGSINNALEHVDLFSEYNDDHAEFSRRPSLEAYRKVGFQIPYQPEDHMKGLSFYGDFRYGGYLLSYEFYCRQSCRVDGAKYSHTDLEVLATCYLPCLARDLEIKNIPTLEGYGDRIND